MGGLLADSLLGVKGEDKESRRGSSKVMHVGLIYIIGPTPDGLLRMGVKLNWRKYNWPAVCGRLTAE